ncbi:serine protease 56-like [Gadus macrocephalus]|uniref:serine protease 56-like n=1 Tax=Gadus macrocephalus TaxID=80720 RepID=UPI0028CB498B|nr:serine protease 56-like [Gadus macrocephalus]
MLCLLVSMTEPVNAIHLLTAMVGKEASEDRALPWIVHLLLDTELICTGVLVQALWVPAPGRCTAGLDTESVAKLAMETTGAQKQGSLVARVVILHPTDPRYNASSWGCNAALLQLASPLPLYEHAQIMCLQEHHGSQDRLPAQVCIVSGWILLEMGLRCSPGVPEGGLWVAFAGAFERCGICGSSPGRNIWKPQHASCSWVHLSGCTQKPDRGPAQRPRPPGGVWSWGTTTHATDGT